MITLAMYTLNLFHPGRLLGRADTWVHNGEQADERAAKDTET